MKKSILISIATVFGLLALYSKFLGFDQKIESQILPWRINTYYLKSSAIQGRFYLIFLLLLGIVALALSNGKNEYESKAGLTNYYSNSGTIILGFGTLLAGIYFFGEYDKWFKNGFFLSAFALVVILNLKYFQLITVKIYKIPILILFFSFFVGFVLMPFFIAPVYDHNEFYAQSSAHYASVVLPGYNFQTGNEVGSNGYGIAVLLLVSLATKFLEFFEVNNDYLLFLVVRIYQLVSIALIFLMFWLINRKTVLLTASFTVLIVAHYNTFGFTNYYPNLSGLRSINFLIGLIFLVLLTRRTRPNLLIYTLISSFFVFLALDTGAPIAVGILVLYLLQTKPEVAKHFQLILKVLYFFSLSFFFVFMLHLVIKFLKPELALNYNSVFGASNWNGAVTKINVTAAFALLISMIFLLRSFQLLKGSKTNTTINLQGSTAAVVLVYLYRYFTRMHEFYLIAIPVPVIVMLSPYFEKNFIALLRARNKVIAVLTFVTISFFGGLSASNSYKLYSQYQVHVKPFLKSECAFAIKLSQNICPTQEILTKMSNYFTEAQLLGDSNQAFFVSSFPAELKIYGFNKNFQYNSLGFDVATYADQKEFLDLLESNHVQHIFIDRQRLRTNFTVAYFHDLIEDSNSFVLESKSYNWEKYRKIKPSE
jgi:hypothetical protein